MHSESAAIHKAALPPFEALGDPTMEYEIRHKQISLTGLAAIPIVMMLKRQSSPAEIEFLKQPGSSFERMMTKYKNQQSEVKA